MLSARVFFSWSNLIILSYFKWFSKRNSCTYVSKSAFIYEITSNHSFSDLHTTIIFNDVCRSMRIVSCVLSNFGVGSNFDYSGSWGICESVLFVLARIIYKDCIKLMFSWLVFKQKSLWHLRMWDLTYRTNYLSSRSTRVLQQGRGAKVFFCLP